MDYRSFPTMPNAFGSPEQGQGQDFGLPDLPVPEPPKASQACLSCRKQKRKCSKSIPACGLCVRMNRQCDYSETGPPPSSEEFNTLRLKVADLEARLGLNGGNGVMSPPPSFASPSSSMTGLDTIGQPSLTYSPPQGYISGGARNRFPAIAFLDADAFRVGGISVPNPSLEVPADVLDLLGNGLAVQGLIFKYFATTHKWMPIVAKQRLTRNMANPIWQAGSDLALLFLCMKLITSRPQDNIESTQNPLYLSAKRFLALMEASGTISLIVLQAGLLIVWYEYGQAIYPAALLTSGWCLRYGNLLGISGHESAINLLGRPGTWTEEEERCRTWWGVLIADRVVSLGSQGYIFSSQEPKDEAALPVNDSAWDEGETNLTVQKTVATPIEKPVAPFPRLCQANVMLGRVLYHHHGKIWLKDTDRFREAEQLYIDVSALTQQMTDEADNTQDYLSLATPLALTYSSLCALCEPYSCSTGVSTKSDEAEQMRRQAVEGLKTVAGSIVNFAEQINASTSDQRDLDRISPVVMGALYQAAANCAWVVRENGDESSQMALDSLRGCLGRLGTRWRNAAKYLTILEAQEFTYSFGAAAAASSNA